MPDLKINIFYERTQKQCVFCICVITICQYVQKKKTDCYIASLLKYNNPCVNQKSAFSIACNLKCESSIHLRFNIAVAVKILYM